jgi:hypothetical protein
LHESDSGVTDLRRAVAHTLDEPAAGYASTSPEVSLPGELAERNAKLINAMAAEGVTCSR